MEDLSTYSLFKIFLEDSKRPIIGWDFSYIADRIVTEPLKWSYKTIILPYVRVANTLLDMGTGGGEFLKSLQPLPKLTCATESYKPNIPIAKKNLEPLGVKVYSFIKDDLLPFENEQFALIINRHESYSTKEVKRILKTNGLFITQQVGWKNNLELNQELGVKSDVANDDSYWDLNHAVKELEAEGFTIKLKMECFPKSICYDIGAIVFYLNAIPWQIPNFSIEKYEPKLKELFLKIQEKGPLKITSHRFVIVATK